MLQQEENIAKIFDQEDLIYFNIYNMYMQYAYIMLYIYIFYCTIYRNKHLKKKLMGRLKSRWLYNIAR